MPSLEKGVSTSRARSQYHFEHDGVPQTRWFGGWTSEYQIETTTLADAISEAGMRVEYIMFDDCFMSSVETAYDLKDVTDYLIGCPPATASTTSVPIRASLPRPQVTAPVP